MVKAIEGRSFDRVIDKGNMAHGVFSCSFGTIILSSLKDDQGLEKLFHLKILTEKEEQLNLDFKQSQVVPLPNNQTPFLNKVRDEVLCLLSGKNYKFDFPIYASGTPFQELVWTELFKVKKGELVSYGELAKRVGRPKAARAIGGAVNKNPIPLIIPCHRVIGSNQKLVGFAPGISFKVDLLRREGHKTNENSVC